MGYENPKIYEVSNVLLLSSNYFIVYVGIIIIGAKFINNGETCKLNYDVIKINL